MHAVRFRKQIDNPVVRCRLALPAIPGTILHEINLFVNLLYVKNKPIFSLFLQARFIRPEKTREE